ncbi:hypothetical protein [uncultured Microbacterium sp.]|uniref:hypothetical protein n=1 Tax=uncultured Microbacterium sp. TaxID=191216 RepID=UPI0035CB284A
MTKLFGRKGDFYRVAAERRGAAARSTVTIADRHLTIRKSEEVDGSCRIRACPFAVGMKRFP